MQTEPVAQHRWLQRMIGEWTAEGTADAGPDKPPEKFEMTESVRGIGNLWVQGEGRGRMPDGSPTVMLITLGYDPAAQRFRGTWIGSMMTHLWIYDGTLDAGGTTLTLESEGPSFAGDGTTGKYRDVVELVNDDQRTLTSHVLRPDGTWTKFMTAHYRRVR